MPREAFVLLLLVIVVLFPLPYLVLFRFGRFRIRQGVLKAVDFELEASEPTSLSPSVGMTRGTNPQLDREVDPMPYLGTGKRVRVSEEAYRAGKAAAATEEMTMEEWVSEVVLQQAKTARYGGLGTVNAAAMPPRNRRSK